MSASSDEVIIPKKNKEKGGLVAYQTMQLVVDGNRREVSIVSIGRLDGVVAAVSCSLELVTGS